MELSPQLAPHFLSRSEDYFDIFALRDISVSQPGVDSGSRARLGHPFPEDKTMVAQSQDFPELYRTCFHFPIIDNHAHPVLKADHRNDLPLEGLVSEAEGKALTEDAVYTLAGLRALPQLAELYGSRKTSWSACKAHRTRTDYQELCKTCFTRAGLQCILFDDGLDATEKAESSKWHDQLTPSPSRRIVRVEIVAEKILRTVLEPHLASDTLDVVPILDEFNAQITAVLTESAQDPNVVGFKSIVCYRTGLDVAVWGAPAAIKYALLEVFKMLQDTGKIRLASKAMNDQVVRMALEVAGKFKKPVQFHTGLGDNDLALLLASPARLQPIIKAYPQTYFVLLHGAYPYTREAGYLAAVYPNVYLDFGEIFPFVSGQGQRIITQQVFELTPTNKIMWSTDGHWWPESFYLSAIQARQTLFDVFRGVLQAGELTESEAVQVVQNVLFHNANRLYNLNLEPNFTLKNPSINSFE